MSSDPAFQADPAGGQHSGVPLRIGGLETSRLHRSLQFNGELSARRRVLLEYFLDRRFVHGLGRSAEALFGIAASRNHVMNRLSEILQGSGHSFYSR